MVTDFFRHKQRLPASVLSVTNVINIHYLSVFVNFFKLFFRLNLLYLSCRTSCALLCYSLACSIINVKWLMRCPIQYKSIIHTTFFFAFNEIFFLLFSFMHFRHYCNIIFAFFLWVSLENINLLYANIIFSIFRLFRSSCKFIITSGEVNYYMLCCELYVT